MKIALDASALLAFLFGEAGHGTVAEVIDQSGLSTVNLAEVISRFVRDGHSPDLVYQQIASSGIEIVPFLGEDTAMVASLVPSTRKFGLSLGGRACLALALRHGIPAITADQVWAQLDLPVEIQLIR